MISPSQSLRRSTKSAISSVLSPFNQSSVIYRLTVEGIPHAVDTKQAVSTIL